MSKRDTIIYMHDGLSLYDRLFLNTLSKHFNVIFLTMKHKPKEVPAKIKKYMIPEPFARLCMQKKYRSFCTLKYYIFLFYRAMMLRYIFKKLQPKLVIGCKTYTYGLSVALSGFHPFFLFIWGSDILLYPKKNVLSRVFTMYSLKKADYIVLNSPAQKTIALRLGASPEKIICFPWIDVTLHKKSIGKYRNNIRERLGWSDKIIVLSNRYHEPIYDVQTLIAAIPYVIKKNKNVRFLICGSGSLTKQLKVQAKKLGIDKYVKFLGNIPYKNMPMYYDAADIYVSTSLSDGTSASLMEALAMKKPVIVTAIPGNKAWIKNYETGLLIPVKKPNILAEKILELANNQSLAKKLMLHGYSLIEKHINWEKNSKLLINAIKNALG